MRTFCIGDVHGCFQELQLLLQKISYEPTEDHLVFLGDLIDRGPDPVGVVAFIRSLQQRANVTVLQGNHDEKCTRYLRRMEEERQTGKRNPMSPPTPQRLSEWEGLGEDNVRWLAHLPIHVSPLPGWFAVHAGFEDRPLSEQKPDKMMRVRFLDPETGKMKGFAEGSMEQPAGTVYWSERWKGPENVVYGHCVHDLTFPRVDHANGAECWGIDTGCVFGGRLSALCLETRQIFQVTAAQKYANLPLGE